MNLPPLEELAKPTNLAPAAGPVAVLGVGAFGSNQQMATVALLAILAAMTFFLRSFQLGGTARALPEAGGVSDLDSRHASLRSSAVLSLTSTVNLLSAYAFLYGSVAAIAAVSAFLTNPSGIAPVVMGLALIAMLSSVLWVHRSANHGVRPADMYRAHVTRAEARMEEDTRP